MGLVVFGGGKTRRGYDVEKLLGHVRRLGLTQE